MTRIISTILFIACIISLHSCRELDEQQDHNVQDLAELQAKTENYKAAHRIVKIPIFETIPKPIIETDPTFKDGGQW